MKYECEGNQNSYESSTEYRKIEYSKPEFSWSFSPGGGEATGKSGSHTFTGLTAGAANTLTATVTLYCTQKIYTRQDDQEGGYTPWELSRENTNHRVGVDSAEITVYTKPGSFTGFAGAKKDVLINDVLNSTSISAWNTHCGKYMSWKNQESKYGTIKVTFPTGQLITADWFNSLRTSCGATES